MPSGRLNSDRRRRGGHASASSLMEDCQKCSSCCCCCFHSDLSLLNERFFIIGVIQLLCGAISIFITVFAVLQKVCLYTQGTGAWAGAFMIAAGILGIICARRKTVCAVVTLLVLSVLAAIAATLQSTFSIRGLLLEVQNQCDTTTHSGATILTTASGSSPSVVAAVVASPRPASNFRNYVIHALLLIFGLLEMGVAVTHAVLSGRLICCQTLISVPVGGPTDASLVAGHRQRPAHLNLLGSHHVILADPALHSAVSGGHSGAAVATAANAAVADRRRAGAFVFVMPSPSSAEPTLIFPTPPPPYNGGERQSLLYAADSLLQPAVIVSEEPPEYATVDPRRSRHNHESDAR